MKKYFPILASIFVFFLLTLGQVVWDIFPLNANQSSRLESDKLAYEYSLKTFFARTIEGQEFEPGFYKNKVVIINFWASWCAPCLEEFPMLTELRTMFNKDDLEIVSINTDEDEQFENIEKLAKQFNFNFDVVVDTDGFFAKKFRVESIPLSLIYFDGKLMEVTSGAMDFSSAENVEKFKKYLESK